MEENEVITGVCPSYGDTFNTLMKVDVNKATGKKNDLTYVPWAIAWQELKKKFPEANYKVYENEKGWNYHTDGKTAWVKVGVTVNGLEHIEYLPVMSYKNDSIPLDIVTSMHVNKAIQRATVKAIARHGLALYIYAGEDMPEEADYLCAKCNQIFNDSFIAMKTYAAYHKYVCPDCLKQAQIEAKQKKGE